MRETGAASNNTTYAVPGCGHAQRYSIFFLLFVFSLAERKNEQRLKWEVPLKCSSNSQAYIAVQIH